MAVLSVNNIVKAFELNNNILDGLSFTVHDGERVGILGKNGAGKTTLFRIITGEIESDEGTVAVSSGARLGLISQVPVFPRGFTTEDVLDSAFERLAKIKSRMDELTALMAEDNSPAVMHEYDSLSTAFETAGGYDTETVKNKVANGLMISAKMRAQSFESLSGGEKTRVNLGRLILEDTDILLLDEPTNYLDMRAVEWLEEYLRTFKGTVLAISHDRYFLENAVNRIVEIVDGKAELYSGSYNFYVEEKQRRFDEKMKAYEKSRKQIEQLQRAADDLHLWAFMGNDKLHKRAFSIEKRIERLKKHERPAVERAMKARFGEKELLSDEALVIKDLKKSFGERTLFEGFSAEVAPGERIAIIGDNGAGKTTLLRMILGEETPDGGYIRFGPAVKRAYLPQIVSFKHPELSLLDTLIVDENLPPQTARDRLGAFKFSGEDVFKSVSMLSGGEKSRLRLCALMKDDINFLILDEPTNHLDIASREWIEDALADYGEALLFVSHDRFFINAFATRIWEIRDGKITDFKGDYERYKRVTALTEAAKPEKSPKSPEKKKKERSPANTEKLLRSAEKEIAAIEQRLGELVKEEEAAASDYVRLSEIYEEREGLSKQLDEAYAKWDNLSE